MSQKKTDLLQGTLDLLILKTLALGSMHGYGISLRIQQISKEVLQVQQAPSIPPCTVSSNRVGSRPNGGASENNRRPRFYRLTKGGRKQLEVETSNWERLSAAVAQILQTT